LLAPPSADPIRSQPQFAVLRRSLDSPPQGVSFHASSRNVSLPHFGGWPRHAVSRRGPGDCVVGMRSPMRWRRRSARARTGSGSGRAWFAAGAMARCSPGRAGLATTAMPADGDASRVRTRLQSFTRAVAASQSGRSVVHQLLAASVLSVVRDSQDAEAASLTHVSRPAQVPRTRWAVASNCVGSWP
jgi:hypothetical protein